MIAFDFETELIAMCGQAPRPVCLSWANDTGSGILHWTEAGEWLRAALPNGLVGANTSFDMLVAAAHYPDLQPLIWEAYDQGRVHCVQTRQKLIDIASGTYFEHRGKYNLAALSARLLHCKLDKGADTWRLRYGELRHLPIASWPPEAREYSIKDSEVTWRVFLEQNSAPADVLEDEPAQSRAQWALGLMSAWGLATDQDGVEALRVQTVQEMKDLEGELKKAGLLVWSRNGRYTKKKAKAQDLMHKAVGFDSKLTLKGRQLKKDKDPEWRQKKYLSVDEEACRDSGDIKLEHFAEYATLDSFLSGHVKALSVPVVHSRFDVLMETGRTSSSNPNVQNVRRKAGARECFVPRPGHCFIGCDYDKAELHTLAQVCINLFKRSYLAEALNSGFDPHTGLGAQLAHVSYEEAVTLLKADNEAMAEWRQRAKPANFGFPGGMGAAGMRAYAKGQYNVILTQVESEQLRAGWARQWPVVAEDYLQWIRNLLGADEHAWIQHFTSNRRRGRITYCQAANSFFQGMAADGMKRAMYVAAKECYLVGKSPLYGCRPVNCIHDELLVEAPLDRASDAGWRLRDVMVQEFNYFTRDVPVRATPCLMDRWSKKAKTLLDSSGNLQVWRYVA